MPTNRNRRLLAARRESGPPIKASRWHARKRALRLKRFDALRMGFYARLEQERAERRQKEAARG